MSNLNNDIERYLRGELTPAEMHALEQRALNDPFLAEALEGALHAGAEHFSADVASLNRSLRRKTKKGKIITFRNSWQWYAGIAASLLLLALSTFTVITMLKEQKRDISKAEQAETTPSPIAADTSATVPEAANDDSLLALNNATSPTLPVDENESPGPVRGKSSRSGATNRVREDERQAVEPVVNEQVPTREREREVSVNLSEPPVIVRNEDVIADEEVSRTYAESTAPSSTAKRAVAPTMFTVRGRITDHAGEALPGVNVVLKGTTLGTVANVAGEYEITIPDTEGTLVFAFIGVRMEERVVEGPLSAPLDVAMQPDVMALSEVVVTGMGVENYGVNPTFEMASPEGGRRAFNRYLEDNVKYPTEAVDKKIEGRVTVQFTVQANGALTDFKVLKGIGGGCDEELIRLIRQGPKWVPSKKNNVAIDDHVKVRMKFQLP